MNIVEKSKTLMISLGATPIMYLLIALSVVSLAIIIERFWFFFRTDDDLASLVPAQGMPPSAQPLVSMDVR